METELIVWLVILAAMIVIEIISMGLTSIWFAGGALAAFLANLAGAGLAVQIVLFFVASIVLLIFTRPLAKKYFNNGRVKTNAESLVGQTAVVTQDIDNLEGKGQAVVQGMEWTARAQSDDIKIEAGAPVEIKDIQGVKLIVKKKELED